MLKKGEFQAHTELVTSTIVKDLGAEFAAGPTIPTSQHFWFNSSRAPMDDPKVRQALIMAIDRDGLIKASFPDGPHKKTDEVINSVPGADERSSRPTRIDPAAAKALLAESTYGGPEKLPKIIVRRHFVARQRSGCTVYRRTVAPEPWHHRRRHEAAAGPVCRS